MIPVPPASALPLAALHVPPPASVSAVILFTHTSGLPVMADGNGFTVTTPVMIQVVGNVYTTVAVPADSPVITPVGPATFMSPLVLLHVPPAGVELRLVVKPTHTVSVPVTVVGLGFTVAIAVTIQPEPRL